MSCDDMYVCENGVQLPSCRIKISMGKCDKFSTVQNYEKFMQEKTGAMAERINVKGHYRVVTRDSKGLFTSVRKWQGSKKEETTG